MRGNNSLLVAFQPWILPIILIFLLFLYFQDCEWPNLPLLIDSKGLHLQNDELAGVGKHSYIKGSATSGSEEAGNLPDLVLVDGRYRVLCCLFVYQLLRSNPHKQISIILDDFVNRRYYEILHSLFDITIIGRVGYLKFKPTDININQLIQRYQYDPR